ncbi:hypothetical protein TUM4641_21870 [Shewanella morhuae]|nr:hypothetical protein TUM4641_21870 [Shewanella morhuae]
MKFFIFFIFAFIGSKLLFKYFDFHYDIFSDSFELLKFIIDTGVFVVIFISTQILYEKTFGKTNKQEQP